MGDSVLVKAQGLANNLGLSFHTQSRYGREKVATLVAYGVLCLLLIGWSFSSPKATLDNALGASVSAHTTPGTGAPWYVIRNASGEDWTKVRLYLDDEYFLEGPEVLKAGESFQASNPDFQHRLYIPRAPRSDSWGSLLEKGAPPAQAEEGLTAKTLTIRAEQGSLRQTLAPP